MDAFIALCTGSESMVPPTNKEKGGFYAPGSCRVIRDKAHEHDYRQENDAEIELWFSTSTTAIERSIIRK